MQLAEPSVDETELWGSGKRAFLDALFYSAKSMSDNLAVEMSRIGIERPSLVIGDAVKNAVNGGGGGKFADTNIIAHCRALFGKTAVGVVTRRTLFAVATYRRVAGK